METKDILPWVMGAGALYLLFRAPGAGAAGGIASGRVPQQFAPYSSQAIALFTEAARVAGLPASWARSDGLHYVMDHESSGWVGRPNYTYQVPYGDGAHRSARGAEVWPQVWAELRADNITARSSATGLGQLKLGKVKRFYPDGVAGIGDPLNEAVGMLLYIEDRYDTPDIAGRYYALPKCTDIGIDPSSYRYSNGDTGVRYSKRALSEYGGPDCKPGGGY
jgi:hypothetical protein